MQRSKSKDLSYRGGFVRRTDASERDRKDRRRFDLAHHRGPRRNAPPSGDAALATATAATATSGNPSFSSIFALGEAVAAATPVSVELGASAAGGGIKGGDSHGDDVDIDIQTALAGLATALTSSSIPDTARYLRSIKESASSLNTELGEEVDDTFVNVLFQILKSQNTELMEDTVNVISSLSSLSHDKIQVIVAEAPVINDFIQGFLSGQFDNEVVVVELINILGNIASDCHRCRSSLYSSGCLPLLLTCLSAGIITNTQDDGSEVTRVDIAVSAGFALINLCKDKDIANEILSSDAAITSVIGMLKTAPDLVKIEIAWVLEQLSCTEFDRMHSATISASTSTSASTSVAVARLPAITGILRGCMETLDACKAVYTSDNSASLNKMTRPLWKAISCIIGVIDLNPVPSDVEDMAHLVPLLSDYLLACSSFEKSQDVLKECIYTFNCACMFLNSVNATSLRDSFRPLGDLISVEEGSRLFIETLPIILRQLVYGQESIQKEAIYTLGSIINLGILTQEMFSSEVLKELENFLSLNVRDVELYIQILTIIKQSILQNPALKSAFNLFNFEHVDNILVDPYTTDPTLLRLCEEVTEIMYAYMESLDGLDDNDDDDGAIEVSAVAFNDGGRGGGQSGVFSFGVGGNGSSNSSISSSFKF